MGSDAASGLLVLVFLAGLWIVPIFVAVNIWSNKGGSGGIGFLMGFFLGWIGVIIAAVATPSTVGMSVAGTPAGTTFAGTLTRTCPHCQGIVKREARICPHCQKESSPWYWHEGYWWVLNENGSKYYLNDATNEWIKYTGVAGGPPST